MLAIKESLTKQHYNVLNFNKLSDAFQLYVIVVFYKNICYTFYSIYTENVMMLLFNLIILILKQEIGTAIFSFKLTNIS